jgi:alcohol dehydrogenase
MLGACHACANPLTAHYGVTHGLAIGIMLPHVLRFNAESEVAELYDELTEEVGLRNGQPGSTVEILADRISALMRLAGLPTRLDACGISSGILPLLAEEANQQWTARFNPRPVGEAELLSLYEAAL